MKATKISLALALSTIVSAVPAMQAAPKLVVRNTAESTLDCSYCTGMLNFCFEVSGCTPLLPRSFNTDLMQNGHTQGQEGCKQTCREHVCHRTPEVRIIPLKHEYVLTY